MKLPDAVIKVKDLELVEFMENVQVILNQGLYEMRITAQVPSWTAQTGETAIYYTGTVRTLYFYVNGVWAFIGFSSTGALQLFDADGNTGITPEAELNEDVLRYYVAGNYAFAMSTLGFCMNSGTPVVFDGTDGDTKWVYDASSTYLRAYVNNTLRMEI